MELLLFRLGGGVVVSAAKSGLLPPTPPTSCSLASSPPLSWLLAAAGENSELIELSAGPGVKHVVTDDVSGVEVVSTLSRLGTRISSDPPLCCCGCGCCCWAAAAAECCCWAWWWCCGGCCWAADHSLPKISSRMSICDEWLDGVSMIWDCQLFVWLFLCLFVCFFVFLGLIGWFSFELGEKK